MDACAGVDQGDGYDCYGQCVAPTCISPYLSPTQRADLLARLSVKAPITLAERVAIQSGALGVEAMALLAQYPQGLPEVRVTASPWLFVLGALALLLIFSESN